MNLDILISAANWLYGNSPAGFVTRENNAILIYGEGELADALFDLLFTTAFKPGITIDLVRVADDADERCEAFLNRNPAGLEYFAKTPVTVDEIHRPLAIHFMNRESDWRSFRFACAIMGEDAGLEISPERQALLEDIPVAHRSSWTASDEEQFPVLRIARRVHTAYTLGWNDRYSEEDIDDELYGRLDGDQPDDYKLRSSIRLAVSIPWKLEIAGASDAETLQRKLEDAGTTIEQRPVRDYLAWQEHRSWQAFMTLDGWRAPTEDEINAYLFQGENDHRYKSYLEACGRTERLHPCLCDLASDDWFRADGKKLNRTARSAWSRAYRDELDEYVQMDRVSLIIHHRCSKIVTSEAYRATMEALFSCLEDALISAYPPRIDIHFGRLRLMENLFLRLENNESNSYHPFEQACRTFLGGLQEDSIQDMEGIREAYGAMRREARVAIERNKYCDYKEIDARIIDWLPWIIHDTSIDTVWKLYTEIDLFENVISAMILRPRRLVFLYTNAPVPAPQMDIYRNILAEHGLKDIAVSEMRLSQFDLSGLNGEDMARHVLDVSGAGDLQHSVIIPPGVSVVYYENGKLRDKAGAPACSRFYKKYIPITVSEMLQMKGQKQISIEEDNKLLGMENGYQRLWEFARMQGGAGNWHEAINTLKNAEKAIRHEVCLDTGAGSVLYTRSVSQEQYRVLIENGGIRSLYDLEKKGALSGLIIDMNGQRIVMNLFSARETEKVNPSAATMDAILSSGPDSEWCVDDEYVAMGAPALVYDLSKPICLTAEQAGRVSNLVKEGLLVPGGQNRYTYSSAAVRSLLKKEGSALEAYVYYTLFLSGRFDDVRSNIKLSTGVSASGQPLEKEVDVMATVNGAMGIISCKDTASVDLFHIVELANQAREYGTIVKPILGCSKDAFLPEEVKRACDMLQVRIIGIKALTGSEASRRHLVNSVLQAVR